MDRPRSATGLRLDSYLLVQAAVYHADGLWGEACFDLAIREACPYPWVVVAGLREAVEGVLDLGFSPEDVAWLRTHPMFRRTLDPFWNWLEDLVFSGDVWAMPEGSVAFPGEPVLRVVAPLPEACLLETRLVRALSAASGVATRAARACLAAGERPVYDFGSRRMPHPEAAAAAARAAWIGGSAGTTDALAASRWGIPVIATMADGLLAAYGENDAAFRAFRLHFPELGQVTLPRADPAGAVEALVPYARSVRMVRVDSPDLAGTARAVREALDRRGLRHVRILGSGSLDADRIAALVSAGAPVDRFAVGRHLADGAASGSVPLAWRLAALARGPVAEPVRHPAGARWPGRKQVVRLAEGDLVCLEPEAAGYAAGEEGQALLAPVVEAGRLVGEPEPVNAMRRRRAVQLATLPEAVRAGRRPWRVEPSPGLRALVAAG